MLYFLKVMLKSPTFLPLFLTNLSQKHKIIFINKMKLGTNSKKLFLHPKSNFTICEKNLQQLRLFLKSYDSFLIFLIFRFLGVLPLWRLIFSEWFLFISIIFRKMARTWVPVTVKTCSMAFYPWLIPGERNRPLTFYGSDSNLFFWPTNG